MAAIGPAVRVTIRIVGNRDIAAGVRIKPTVGAWCTPTPVSRGDLKFVAARASGHGRLPNAAAQTRFGHERPRCVPHVEIAGDVIGRRRRDRRNCANN